MVRLFLPFAALLFCGAPQILAQAMQSNFPYSVPILQPIADGPANLAEPAQEITERISVKDGHFVKPDGTRIRLFGTTLWYSGVYPDSADAVDMARQMRSYGINAVRFNLHDYSTWGAATFLQPNAERFELSEAQMARFDWLMYQFKLNGIYVHLPLLSRRTAGNNDALTHTDSIPGLQRGVIYFDPELRAAQRVVIGNLLRHRNPHTGVQYKDEPTLAFLDLHDNSSFFWVWRTYGFEPNSYDRFSSFHSQILHGQWADYLRSKYKTDAALNAAWSRKASRTDNLISSPDFEDPFANEWTLNFSGGAQAALDPYEGDSFEGELALRVRIGAPGGGLGNIQIRNTSIELERDRAYEISFMAKTDNPSGKLIRLYLTNPVTPFNNYGVNNVRFNLSDEWERHTYVFRSRDDNEFGARLRIDLGQQIGDFFIDDIAVRMLDEDGLRPGESLQNDQIGIVEYNQMGSYALPRVHENIAWFNDLVQTHYEELNSYIKETLNCEALVCGNNSSYMLNDLYTQRNLDFTSIVQSWDYVRNSGSAENWFIGNNAMLKSTNGGNIAFTAHNALLNTPMVMAQMTMPNPSIHGNEVLTIWPAYAAYQDFDAMYVGVWSDNRTLNRIEGMRERGFWETRNNPAFMSMLPAASHAFRHGLIAEAEQEILIEQTQSALLTPARQLSWYMLESSTDNRLPLFRKTRLASFDSEFQTSFPQRDIFELSTGEGVNTAALESDTREILWNADDGYITVDTDRYKMISGDWDGELLELGAVSANRIDDAAVGSFSWVSLSDDTIEESDESLITISSRAQNSGAVWRVQPDRGADLSGGWGEAPTVVEVLNLELVLESERDSLVYTALDSMGNPAGEPTVLANAGGFFRFGLDQAEINSMWFHVELRDEEQVSTSVDEQGGRASVRLAPPYPNPAGHYSQVAVRGKGSGAEMRLDLISVLGVNTTLWRGVDSGTTDVINLRLENVESGAYRLVLYCGEASSEQMLIVNK